MHRGLGISGALITASFCLLQLEAYILVSVLPSSALTRGLVARSPQDLVCRRPLPAFWVDSHLLSSSQVWDPVHPGLWIHCGAGQECVCLSFCRWHTGS